MIQRGPLRLLIDPTLDIDENLLSESISVLVPTYFASPETFYVAHIVKATGRPSIDITQAESQAEITLRVTHNFSIHALARALASFAGHAISQSGCLPFHSTCISNTRTGNAFLFVGPELSGKTSTLMQAQTRLDHIQCISTNVTYINVHTMKVMAGTLASTARRFDGDFSLDLIEHFVPPDSPPNLKAIFHIMPSHGNNLACTTRDPLLLFNTSCVIPNWTSIIQKDLIYSLQSPHSKLIQRTALSYRLNEKVEISKRVSGSPNYFIKTVKNYWHDE